MTNSRTILLVDDDEGTLSFVRRVLGAPSLDIFEVKNGMRAVEAARAHRFDLIVLDVGMPGLNGYEVCRALRAEEFTRGIPILVLSGLSEDDAREAALNSGANDFVGKPFLPDDLEARVEALLRRDAPIAAS